MSGTTFSELPPAIVISAADIVPIDHFNNSPLTPYTTQNTTLGALAAYVAALVPTIATVPPARIVTASTTLNILSTDQNIGLQRTVGVAAMIANLPPGAVVGQAIKIEDLVGNLQAFPVTVTPPAGQTITGRSTYVMNQDFQSSTFRYYGSNVWSVG